MTSRKPEKILVTGARGSLGQAVVDRLLKEGYDVTGTWYGETDRNQKEPAPIHWIEVNLTDSSSVKEAISQFEGGSKSHFDALIHCAGGFRYSETEKLTDRDFDFLLKTNLCSAFYLVRELIPGMKQRNFGRIVFISSQATLQPRAGVSAYAASKAGLNMLTASLADEIKDYNITVNAVLPSVIDTPANRKDMPQADFSKWVPREHLADLIQYLLSPQASSIRGALIPVAGKV